MSSVFVSPDGKEFEVDDPTHPAAALWIKENGLKQKMFDAKDAIKSGISGVAEGVARTPFIMGDLAKLQGILMNKVLPNTYRQDTIDRLGSQPWLDTFRGSTEDEFLKNTLGLDITHKPQTTAGEYIKPVGSAIGGATALGGLGAVPGRVTSANSSMSAAKAALTPSMLAINGGAGAAGQLGYDVSRGFDSTKEGNPLIAMLAAAGFGTGGNTVRQLALPNGRQTMYNATKGMTDKQWEKTTEDLKAFSGTGSDTYTLADLPELQPRLGGTARGLSNTTGGDLLGQKLSLQARQATKESDIPRLLKSIEKDVLERDVDPRQVASIMSQKGRAQFVPPGITAVSQIPKVAEQGPPAPMMALPANRAVTPDVRMPPKLGEPFPPPPQIPGRNAGAEDVPFRFTPDLSLSERLPGTARNVRNANTIISKLREIPSHKLGEEIKLLGLSEDEIRQVAKVMAERLQPIPNVTTAPSFVKTDRDIFENLIEMVNPELRKSIGNKLTTADSLSRLSAEHSTDRSMNLNLSNNAVSTMANPFGSVARRAGLRTTEKEAAGLSELLANPTPENLKKLQDLSKVDPRARRYLEWLGTAQGVSNTTQTTGDSR